MTFGLSLFLKAKRNNACHLICKIEHKNLFQLSRNNTICWFNDTKLEWVGLLLLYFITIINI